MRAEVLNYSGYPVALGRRRSELLRIAFRVGDSDKMAPIRVTAFLCGFRERFAPGILDSTSKLFATSSTGK